MKKPQEPEGFLTARVSPALVKSVNALCAIQNESRSDFVRRILEDAIKAQPYMDWFVLFWALELFQDFLLSAKERGMLSEETYEKLNRDLEDAYHSDAKQQAHEQHPEFFGKPWGERAAKNVENLADIELEPLQSFVDRFYNRGKLQRGDWKGERESWQKPKLKRNKKNKSEN